LKQRWWLAAAALAGAAAVLVVAEPWILGGVLSERRGGLLSLVVQQGPFVCAWAALLAALVGAGWLPRPARLRVSTTSLRSVLFRGIPIADARTVGLYRIVLGAGVWIVLDFHPIAGPWWVQLVTRAAVVFFTAGLFARASLAVLSAGVYAWMHAWTTQFGSHPVGVLVLALPCLLPCRWSDARSVDVRIGRTQPQPPSMAYGYGVWMPLFIVGVALFAAAWAKVSEPGWIANGTVKFAFVADAHRASVPWGLWIASRPGVAVAVSTLTVIVEAGAILAAFTRSWIVRLAIGAVVAALFSGFYLFQGELWRAWWLLFTAFLPWSLLSRALDRMAAPAAAALPSPAAGPAALQRAVIAAVVVQQAVASVAGLELRPAVSAYDMYSTTFRSPAAFDRANPMYRYRFEAVTAAGTSDVTGCFAVPAGPDVARAWAGETAAMRAALEVCDNDVPPALRSLRLYESLQAFDWQRGTFYWKFRDRQVWEMDLSYD
jgi:hypothetical protein